MPEIVLSACGKIQQNLKFDHSWDVRLHPICCVPHFCLALHYFLGTEKMVERLAV
jgi:hypothetical protein